MKIELYGSKILRKKTNPVKKISKKILKLIEDMQETMLEHKGLGLSACQVGESISIMLVDMKAFNKVEKMVLINPKILKYSGETEKLEEGCLSFPNVYIKIKRSKKIKVSAKDIKFKPVNFEAEGLLARVIQHEVDHLNGVLFIDKLNKKDLKKIKSELEKIKAKQLGII